MATIAIAYRGGGAARSGLPARDMDLAEIEALASARKVTPEDFVAQLVDTGLYVAIVDEPAEAAATEPALADMKKADLLAIADELGIAEGLGKRPTNDALVAAIEAEQQRLADEAAAAAASASDSGEGDSAQERLGKLSDDELAVVAQEYEVDASGLERDALIEAIATKAGYAAASSDQA